MKINTKLTISCMIITITAMLILTLVINIVITEHIESGIREDLVLHNDVVVDKLSYINDPERALKVLVRNDKSIMTFIVDYQNETILSLSDRIINPVDYAILAEELTINELNPISLFNKEALAYPQLASVGDKNYLICTAIFNNDISSITDKITNVVVILIFIVSLIIIFITGLISKIITKPLHAIMSGTKYFSEKQFDNQINVNTKDEFNVLAKAMNDMAQSLKRRDIEQKKFYEDYSHELKTPLTVISGYTQGISSGVIIDSENALAIIVKECEQLKKQIENMIYLSKLDTTNDFFKFESVELNQHISESLIKLDSLIILKDLNIEFEAKEKIYIQADKEKLQRAFVNLFSNSIKYTTDTIEITCALNQNDVTVSITDNGQGFSDKILSDPFSRSIIGSKSGSGIGLSIVKKIIDKHNATLSLSNTENGGACYKIILPLSCHN